MGQRNDLALKRRIIIDGTEYPGLVSCGEIKFEDGVIEAPEFNYVRNIRNGITKVPQFDVTYKLDKGSPTLPFLRSWYINKEAHDLLVIDTDATGQAFQQYICSSCEVTTLSDPDYDAKSPDYARYTLHVIPFNVTPVDPA